jgi:hypothetical protein
LRKGPFAVIIIITITTRNATFVFEKAGSAARCFAWIELHPKVDRTKGCYDNLRKSWGFVNINIHEELMQWSKE